MKGYYENKKDGLYFKRYITEDLAAKLIELIALNPDRVGGKLEWKEKTE